MVNGKGMPEVAEYNGVKTLMVKGRPFFMLAGETHNSSSGNPEYMESNVWPYLRQLHLNTLFVPVMWNLSEMKQGNYDFRLAERLILQARRENVHLVLLWFGLWKNGESDYVPDWVKTDTKTYFRALNEEGLKMNCVSPFCSQAVEADARAFEAFMGFLKEFDGEEQTVIMVQVENETGLLGACRDFGAEAEACFRGKVPDMLYGEAGGRDDGEEKYDGSGNPASWESVYGEDAGEAMMAWAFASAVETIAARGKRVYPLPMYTNAWVEQFPWRPGTYPSGGPVSRMSRIWKQAAPTLLGVEPDIYLADMVKVMKEYDQEDNPLIIPEARRDVRTASYAIYSIFGLNALGYSPFGIEDIGKYAFSGPEGRTDQNALGRETLESLQISLNAYDPAGTAQYLSASYLMMDQLQELYLAKRGTDHFRTFIRSGEDDRGGWIRFRKYEFMLTYQEDHPRKPVACGGIVELDEDTFLLFGCRYRFQILPRMGRAESAGILSLEDGIWTEGKWKASYVKNGDEKQGCALGEMPGMCRLHVYLY